MIDYLFYPSRWNSYSNILSFLILQEILLCRYDSSLLHIGYCEYCCSEHRSASLSIHQQPPLENVSLRKEFQVTIAIATKMCSRIKLINIQELYKENYTGILT